MHITLLHSYTYTPAAGIIYAQTFIYTHARAQPHTHRHTHTYTLPHTHTHTHTHTHYHTHAHTHTLPRAHTNPTVMESTYSALSYRYLDTAEKLGSNCLKNSKSAALKKCQAASDKVACMRALPAAEVVGCTGAGAPHLQVKPSDGLFADFTFPNIDGYALKCPILEAFAATDGHCGDLPDAKVMIGSTQREMAFFTAIQWPLFPGIGASDWAGMKETMYRRVARLPKDQAVPKAVMAKLDSLYNNLEDYDKQAKDMTTFFSTTAKKTITKEQMMLDAMSGDASFVGNPQMIAQALVKGGRNPYVYQFSNVLSDKVLGLVGPGHAMDLGFIFGDLAGHLSLIKQDFMFRKEKVTFTAAEEALADQVSEYWLNFARYLDPSPQGSKLPKWSATGKGTPKWLEITTKAPVLREQAYFHSEQVNFWLQVHLHMLARKNKPAPRSALMIKAKRAAIEVRIIFMYSYPSICSLADAIQTANPFLQA